MKNLSVSFVLLLLIVAGCAKKAPDPIAVQLPTHSVSYLHEIKPILDKRCAVCHSCYNSPCQLKLNSYEGVERGGSKKSVYNATRLTTMDPTRLFVDAKTTEEWRQKDFHTVTESSVSGGLNNSLMLQILNHKMKNPESTGEYRSEAEDLTCSETSIELDGYLSKHPNRGMPFGFPPLKQQEFELIAGWLAQGARGPTDAEQQELTSPKVVDAAEIVKWETFFNNPDPKYAMTARYLYEHLFLAHIKFDSDTNEYYELLRSTTPPGSPVELIDTVRPYDDPGTETFYYRFRKIHSTIVHKTHMVFDFDDAALARYTDLFIDPDWLEEPHLVGYSESGSANPFDSFGQIPPRSRYQFLLDNSHYIIMTFIRGPVCRGQIALNVIHDHFWVMFQDPDHDLSVQYPGFLKLQKNNLIMPIEKGSRFPVIDLVGNKYDKALSAYYEARQNYYMTHNYDGQGYDAIWKGNKASDSPILTVYRHFDSASVHKGVLGDLPRTMWVMDYPQLERIYYALVAGFDVYGTLGHQLAVRLYMDGLREEGESYFLGFMPEEQRRSMMESWYKGVDPKNVTYYDAGIPSKIQFKTDDPKREFIEEIVNNYILPETGIKFDRVNYLPKGKEFPPLPDQYETMADYLQAFRSVSQPGTEFFSLVDDFNANVVYVRIRKNDGTDAVVSLVINRWHDNVTFMFNEKKALDPTKDNADFLVGFYGSYPNYFIDIQQDDLPDFFDLLANLSKLSEEEASMRFRKYGINRANTNFWEHYDWFQERFNREQPVQSGLFDLNRYFYEASAASLPVDF
ncbi:Fatty acid cis/trans isomerase (CTI) [Desulfocapsa sulfexigens DSM 10523]|uniref:Fatty acid cis/trans isomerase (CTI) n=1 Tax=Desulfocapsa sulfexigens (strain DSM 10523 / SB164P1) TaxID=1167006 RepID=M1NCR2_DESSD|nr:fatty acid cis/trans isomerase [Desulfocapsa sulfexigens]AGF77529.1 Fatty acid cis/trans isomerase (CTI) [Desulfocapsa sulfexigens DSM 10523]